MEEKEAAAYRQQIQMEQQEDDENDLEQQLVKMKEELALKDEQIKKWKTNDTKTPY